MANFNFVNSAKFRPFSYQEMLQPVQAYTQAYNETQDGLGELGAKADVFDQLANQQTDPITHARYKQYADELTKQAELLATQGLNPTSRQGLTDLKRRYSKDIIPIEQGYTKRQGWIDAQMKGKMADSTLIVEDASGFSLDDIIANPAMAPNSYSGREIINMSAQASAAIAKEMRDDPRKWSKILDNQYYETMMRKGATKEEVIATLMNDANSNPELRKILEDTIASTGISKWRGVKDAEGNLTDYGKQLMKQVEYFAGQGLWSSIGDTTYQTLANQKELLQAKNSGTEPPNKNTQSFRAVPKTKVDGDKKTTELNDELKFVQQLRANPELLKEVRERRVGVDDPDRLLGTRGNLQYSQYKDEEYKPNAERLQQIIKKYDMKDGNMDQLEQKLQADIRSSSVRNFVYKPNITQSDLIAQVLKENARTLGTATESTGLYELNDNRKGDPIKLEDISGYFTGDNDISYDPEVGLIINATEDGTTKSAVIDPELIDDADRNVAGYMKNINVLLENGYDVEAQKYIKTMMNYIYGKFNTLAKRQSNTDSKLE